MQEIRPTAGHLPDNSLAGPPSRPFQDHASLAVTAAFSVDD
jgi:hypothetical protein